MSEFWTENFRKGFSCVENLFLQTNEKAPTSLIHVPDLATVAVVLRSATL